VTEDSGGPAPLQLPEKPANVDIVVGHRVAPAKSRRHDV
jgi:hypothetical protein